MSNSIYSTTKSLSFYAVQVKMSGIKALKSARLSFYEKRIILMLQRGICASTSESLIQQLSDFLNISKDFVSDFINILESFRYINYDPQHEIFQLIPLIKPTIDRDNGNAMFLDLVSLPATCEDIYYIVGAIPQGSANVPESYDSIHLCGVTKSNLQLFAVSPEFGCPFMLRQDLGALETRIENAVDLNQEIVTTDVLRCQERLNNLIRRAYEGSSAHISQVTATPEFPIGKCYSVAINVLATYSYDSETGVSHLMNVTPPQSAIPDDFSNALALFSIERDSDIPRHVRLRDSFYRRLDTVSTDVEQSKMELSAAQQSVGVIRSEIIEIQEELKSWKDGSGERKAAAFAKEQELKDSIANNEVIADSYLGLINDGKDSDDMKAYYEGKCSELAHEKENLSRQLEDVQNELAKTDEKTAEEASRLEQLIAKKEEDANDAVQKVSSKRQQAEEKSKALEALLSNNRADMNELIRPVLVKYPVAKNTLNLYVNKICTHIDFSVSASDSNALDVANIGIDESRELYRKVLKAIFDTLMGQSPQSLAFYLDNAFNLESLNICLEQHGVQRIIVTKLVSFHQLANAVGHSTENGPQKENNQRRISDFRAMSADARRQILLSLPNLFSAISLTNAEVKSIDSKLRQ